METLLLSSDSSTIYLAFFLALMGGAIGLPIPEDIPLLLAGAAIQQGLAQPLPLFLVCYSGVMLGDILIYSVGRWCGPWLQRREWIRKHLPPSRVKRIRRGLERQAFLSIFIARHLFYLRSITFLTCGIVRMKVWRFLLADALAAIVSASIMFSIGYFASEHIETALARIGVVKNWVLILIVLVGVGIAIHFLVKRFGPRPYAAVNGIDPADPLRGLTPPNPPVDLVGTSANDSIIEPETGASSNESNKTQQLSRTNLRK